MTTCPKCNKTVNAPVVIDVRKVLGLMYIHTRCNLCGHDFEERFVGLIKPEAK